jgi:hypothetical protein
MAKLQLKPNPTFRAKVAIPVAGGDAVDVEFTFKHRTRDELQKFIDDGASVEAEDRILAMAESWDLSDPFSRENVAALAQNYIAAPMAIFETYLDELVKARRKN